MHPSRLDLVRKVLYLGERGERKNHKGLVYVIRMDGTSYYKIGYSKNPEKRMKSLDVGPVPLEIEFTWYTNYPREEEAVLHGFFRESKTRDNREWFDLGWNDLVLIQEAMQDPKELASLARIVWGIETGEWLDE